MPTMNLADVGGQYRVPPEPSRWPSIALAVAMHAESPAQFLMSAVSVSSQATLSKAPNLVCSTSP